MLRGVPQAGRTGAQAGGGLNVWGHRLGDWHEEHICRLRNSENLRMPTPSVQNAAPSLLGNVEVAAGIFWQITGPVAQIVRDSLRGPRELVERHQQTDTPELSHDGLVRLSNH